MTPHLVHNVPVQTALEAWAATKNAQTFANVLRQCVAGELLLDISDSTFADPDAGFQAGDTLALGRQTDTHGKDLLVAFTSNERLSAYRRGERVRSLAQPAWSVLAEALSRADGVAIDPGHDALCIAYAEEIRAYLTDEPGHNAALKNAIARPDADGSTVLSSLNAATVVYAGVEESRDDAGVITAVAAPSAVGEDGGLLHPVFTSPAEVFAWSPGLVARATSLATIVNVAREDGHTGILLDPAGPSAVVRLDELA